uniref:Uncharacterized protein n=1 Tax=Candidatus Berkiella aquae TaxID=295108 RepID=A0A0Q9YF69_9GAMM
MMMEHMGHYIGFGLGILLTIIVGVIIVKVMKK